MSQKYDCPRCKAEQNVKVLTNIAAQKKGEPCFKWFCFECHAHGELFSEREDAVKSIGILALEPTVLDGLQGVITEDDLTDGVASMPDYQKRVIDEKRDIDKKIAELDARMPNTKFEKLPEEEFILINAQRRAMVRYSVILGQRIDRFRKGASA